VLEGKAAPSNNLDFPKIFIIVIYFTIFRIFL